MKLCSSDGSNARLQSCVQVVESHKPAQPQQPPIPQSKEALSEVPVRELKDMLQARHISYIGASLHCLPNVQPL